MSGRSNGQQGPPMGGPMTRRVEEDCCGCIPIETGVRVLFFGVVLAWIAVVVNIVIGAVNEWWYVFIQLIFLIPMTVVLCYIGAWASNDTYSNRKGIANGFLVTWILSILANLIILFIVIFALEEFYETDEWNDEMRMMYGNQMGYGNNMYGHGNNINGYGNNIYGHGNNIYGHGKDMVMEHGQAVYGPSQEMINEYGNLHGKNVDYTSTSGYGYNNPIQNMGQYNPIPMPNMGHNRLLAEDLNKTGAIKSNAYYNQAYYNQNNEYGQQGQGPMRSYQDVGTHGGDVWDEHHDQEKVEDEIIVNFALLYGAFILIYGFGGFYWWTVMNRWANCKRDMVMMYNNGMNGMNGGGCMCSQGCMNGGGCKCSQCCMNGHGCQMNDDGPKHDNDGKM